VEKRVLNNDAAWLSERIVMESKGDTLPIALTIVVIAIYTLFGIFVLTAIVKISCAVL
jgi:hypothetical protein